MTKLEEMYEKSLKLKQAKVDRENQKAAQEYKDKRIQKTEMLKKIASVCEEGLIPKPKIGWFKKICPYCNDKLEKKQSAYCTNRVRYSDIINITSYRYYVCLNCDYIWSNKVIKNALC